MKNTNISGVVLLCLSLSACNHQNEAAHEAELRFNGDTVSVSPTSPIMGKISIDTTALTLYKTSFTTVGTVRAEAGKLAEAGVPFDGRTIKAHVRLGQQVRAGQPLFSFSSAEASDLAKSYFQAVSGEELARKELARKTALKEKGIASERELEAAYAADATVLNAGEDEYFYVIACTGLSISSCGGVEVNEKMQAVRADGSAIENLFVVGNDSFGNIMSTGAEYSIGGDAGMWCMGSADVAAKTAVQMIKAQ